MKRFRTPVTEGIDMRHLLSAALVVMLLGTALLTVPAPSSGGKVEIFSNGNSSRYLEFPNGGGEQTVSINLPVGGQVLNTTLSVLGEKVPNQKSFTHSASSDFSGQNENVSIAYDSIRRNPMSCRFSAMSPFAAGDGPHYIAAGDLNGDGLDDVAVTNRYSNSTGIFYQAGGSLGTMVSVPLPGSPTGVAMGDINGDGRQDLVVAWFNDTLAGTVSVFNQTLSGQIGTRDDLVAGNYPDGLAIGDINNDTQNDIAVANWLDGTVGVLMQRPGGGFYNMTGYASGNGPRGVAIGDVNNDGLDDIVAASYLDNKTMVIYQDSNGQLHQPETVMDAGFGPVGVAIGDVDNNGRPDIIVTNSKSNLTSAYYQKPDGTLIGRSDVPGSYSWPWGVAAGDLNDDGKCDFAVANFWNGTDTVDVLVQDITERPAEALNLHTDPGMSPDGIAIGDLNNDGLNDIVVANNKGDSIGIFTQLPYWGLYISPRVPNPINITSTLASWNQTLKGAPVKVELSNDDGGTWSAATSGTDLEFSTVGSNFRYRVNFSSASVLEDVHVNITLETLYPSDLTLDVGLDGTNEWTWPGLLTTSEAIPDLSASMTAYVAAHASEADPEGNVSVPLRFTSATAGWLYLSGLSVNYNMPPTITDYSPKGVPINMNEGMPATFGVNASDKEDQPLSFCWSLDGTDLGVGQSSFTYTSDFSSSGGHNLTVTVHDGFGSCSNNWELRVKNVNRPPVLADTTPGANASVSEGLSMMFHALASDPDSDNLTVDWYLDLAKVKTEKEGDATFGYHPGFGDGGAHNITIMAYDGAIRTIYSWAVSVISVNPLTELGLSFPVDGSLSVDEASSQNFSVDLAPLKALLGDSTAVKWSLDGTPTVNGGEYLFVTDYLSSGTHTVRASAFVGKLTYTRSWNVTVIEKDNPPSLASSTPGYNPNVKENTKQVFSVVVTDPDNDALTYKWYLNGTEVATAASYTYEAGWKSQGSYTVMVVVSDGRIAINHSWQMTVQDVAQTVPAGGIGSDVLLGIIAAVVVVAVLGVVMFFAYRRREKFSDALDHFGAGAQPATGTVQAAPLPVPQPDVTPKPKPKATYPCPNCGGQVEEDWFLCHHCDAPLQVMAPSAERAVNARENMAGDEALHKAQMKVEASECPKCGKMLDAAAENCPTCGEYIRRPMGAAVMPASMATCPSCKSPVEEGWMKCPECGAELGAKGNTMPLPPTPPAAQPAPAPPGAVSVPPQASPAAAPTAPPEAAPVAAVPTCPICGAVVETSWMTCPECGKQLK
jgi:hypothetical protein